MTFTNSAWAIDGATMASSQARSALYNSTSGAEGVAQKTDLLVYPLAVPGNGIRIGAGAGIILNRYKGDEDTTDETYGVTNPAPHSLGPSEMPASNPAIKTYIVCVSIGDPEFSQIGHPWMTSDDPAPGEESDFDYVRPIVVLETDFNARTWPAIALARLTVPANTTTITSGMIVDLRALARPRTFLTQASVGASSTPNPLNAVTPTRERWPNLAVLTVKIPSWAVKAKIYGFVEGAKLTKSGFSNIRPAIEGTALVGATTNIDENLSGGTPDRRAYNVAGEIDVTTVAGQTKTFSISGTTGGGAAVGALTTDVNTSVFLSVYFEEQPTYVPLA